MKNLKKTLSQYRWITLALLVSVIPLTAKADLKSETLTQPVALVIGNRYYHNPLPISAIGNRDYPNSLHKNRHYDTDDMAELLSKIGFKVTLIADPKQDDFLKKVSEFIENDKDAEMSVFYYSGLSDCIDGQLYLKPFYSEDKKDIDLASVTVPIDRVLHEWGGKRRKFLNKNLIILETSTGNCPLPIIPSNTIIFSAGESAFFDITGRNSVMTKYLLAGLGEQEELHIVLAKIRKLTNERPSAQSIKMSSNVFGLFYLTKWAGKENHKGASSATGAPAPAAGDSPAATPKPPATEAAPVAQPDQPPTPAKD